MADSSTEKSSSDAKGVLKQMKEKVAAAVEEAKPKNLATKAFQKADNFLSRGIEGVKSVLQNIEERKQDISSKVLGAASSLTQQDISSDVLGAASSLTQQDFSSKVQGAASSLTQQDFSSKVQGAASSLIQQDISSDVLGAASLLTQQDFSSKVLGAASSLTHASGGGASGSADLEATTAPAPKEGEKPGELPEPTENQPLVPSGQRDVERASWKSCCGILECLRSSDR